MEDVQHSDEELVGVLLLIAGQVTGVGPDQVEQLERDVWRGDSRVELPVYMCGWNNIVSLYIVECYIHSL